MAGGGNFVVVWNEVYQIYAQRYTASGSKSGSQIIVASVPAVSPTTIWEPSVAMNATGRFVVTYEFTGSPEKFLAQTYNVNGTPAGTPVSFGSGDAYGSTATQVAMDSGATKPSRGPTAGKMASIRGLQDAHMSRLAAGDGGGPRDDGEHDDTGLAGRHHSAATGNGSFVVAWQGFGPGDDAGIFAQRYEPLPPPLPPPGGGGRFTSAEEPNKSHSVAALLGQSAQDRANFPPFFVGGGTLPAFEVFHDRDDVNDISLAFASTVSHRRFDVIDLRGWATRFTALLGVETIY